MKVIGLLGLLGMLAIPNICRAATMRITVPDELVPQLLEAFAQVFNRPETVIDEHGNEVPNPETKAQFAKRHIRRFIRDVWRVYKSNRAAEEAKKKALEQAETETKPIVVE